jgi:hypothetical protein
MTRHRSFLAIGFVVVAVVIAAFVSQTWLGSLIAARMPWAERSFPEVSMVGLDERQQAVIEVLRTEFEANPAGTKYSEGVKEPWCADFVSWVMREAGAPLSNPHSGSWRIPGVYTLTDYFKSTGQFRAPGYQPKPGDVVLYSPDWRLGQHTNFVVAVSDGEITTVGGNEGGVNRGEVALDDPEIVGFGVLAR